MFLLAQRDSSDKFEICLFIKKLIRALSFIVWFDCPGEVVPKWTGLLSAVVTNVSKTRTKFNIRVTRRLVC